jgi:glycosyltransferase involved in cell wall biosynthesis
MLIGIDASRAVLTQRSGVEHYSLDVICSLIKLASEHRFRLYVPYLPPDDLFPASDRVEFHVIRRRRFWTHMGLGPAVRREPPDVLFVPSHVIPWPGTGRVPSVVTIHDLGYLHFPGKHSLLERIYLDWSTRHSAQTARRVLAVSEATKHDLTALNGIPAEKICVVHSGIDKDIRRVDNPHYIAALRQRLGIPGPFVLHVGRVQARKNLPRLVEAFGKIRDVLPNLRLVLAGRAHWGHEGVETRIKRLGLTGCVVLPGFVSPEDLSTLYSAASVFAFPSLYEGFGFPVLEAMACGTPVVCSNTSSLPELVGDAALMIAPTDVDALAEAIARALTDEPLRQALIARGFDRVKQFTWDAAARATLDVLLQAGRLA